MSKGIKQIISLNGKASDPKDNKNYIYAIDVKNQKWQLMTYLENGTDIRHLSLITPSYATESNSIDNYRDRPVYIYWDKLWIITDENKVPIQFQYTAGSGVNLLDIQTPIITYIGGDVGDGGKSTSTWNILATQIEASLSGTLSCGSRSYSGYSLSWLSHNQTSNFIKENSISHGTQNLQLTITCINGEYDTQNAIETITSTSCVSWYVSYNNSCVENVCSGSIPAHAHSTATSQNHLTEWNFSTPGECSFECNLNYTYDSSHNSCQPDNKTESCGAIPTNSIYHSVSTISQTWDGTEWLPSNISTHDFNSSTSECRFTCNPWYTYDLGSNTCVWNSCTIPATDTYNSKTYTIATPGTLLHNNSVTKSGTYAFGTSPNNGTISADFVYSCNAWVLSKTVSNNGGSCSSWYSFNNNYSAPACSGNSCTTPTSGVHSGLTYTLTSQSVAHGSSVTVTSANRAFGTSPANGTTSAQFTYSCNAGVISLASTANNAGSCNTGYTFNNNYSSPACWGNSCNTPTSGVHSGLTYTLTSQSLAHGNSVTITSANRAFGVSPAHGNTSAQFTYSCNAGVITLTSTANNAGACGAGYTFNNNYASPACTANCPAGMNLEWTKCRSNIRPKNTFYNAYYDCVNNFWTTFIGTNSYDSNVYWRSSSTSQVNYMCGSWSFSCYPDIFPPTNLSWQCKSAAGTMNTIFQSHHSIQWCTPAYDGTAYYQCYKSL